MINKTTKATLNLSGQIRFWLAALAVLIFCIWLFNDILLPFIAGMVLAYFMDPVADWLERHKIPRLAATAIILGTVTVVFFLLILLVAPMLGAQISGFAENLPGHLRSLSLLINDIAPDWLKAMVVRSGTTLTATLSEYSGKIALWMGGLLTSVWSGSMALVNALSLLVVTPVVAFYMLNDWDRMVAKVDSWLPLDHRASIRSLATEINTALAGFIRGQGTVCLLLGSFYAIGLIVVGLKFGLLIGFTAGILSFIPYVGALIGGVLAIGMALAQFWPDWLGIIQVGLVFVIGQFIEGNILSPRLVGGSVGLHPVWLMFALFAFGYLFGFVGLLLAVPLSAAIGVLLRFAMRQYLTSSFYLGHDGGIESHDGEE